MHRERSLLVRHPGNPCGEGERCEGGTCICDPDTCAGCCQGKVCRPATRAAWAGGDDATCTTCGLNNCRTDGMLAVGTTLGAAAPAVKCN